MRRVLSIALAVLLSIVPSFAVTTKMSYRATNTAFTVTSLNSLATTANLAWASALVDNNTNQDLDEIVSVTVTSGASGVSGAGVVAIYVYSCVGGTTSCADTVTGSQGTFTLTSPTNLVFIKNCNVVANATAYNCAAFSVANAFGGSLPVRWGVAIVNLSGAALSSSGNAVVYDSLQLLSQ
jgi:hypothetical protein